MVVCATSSAFVLTNQRTITRVLVRVQSTPEGDAPAAPAAPAGPTSKGFGTVKAKVEKEEEPKDAGTMTYDAQAKRGVPEYNIFLRPTNGSEAEWTPVGSMTIPRDTAVSKAVLEVEEELLKGIHPPIPCPYLHYPRKGHFMDALTLPLLPLLIIPLVFLNELLTMKGAFKLYPKLKAFWDVRSDKTGNTTSYSIQHYPLVN